MRDGASLSVNGVLNPVSLILYILLSHSSVVRLRLFNGLLSIISIFSLDSLLILMVKCLALVFGVDSRQFTSLIRIDLTVLETIVMAIIFSLPKFLLFISFSQGLNVVSFSGRPVSLIFLLRWNMYCINMILDT